MKRTLQLRVRYLRPGCLQQQLHHVCLMALHLQPALALSRLALACWSCWRQPRSQVLQALLQARAQELALRPPQLHAAPRLSSPFQLTWPQAAGQAAGAPLRLCLQLQQGWEAARMTGQGAAAAAGRQRRYHRRGVQAAPLQLSQQLKVAAAMAMQCPLSCSSYGSCWRAQASARACATSLPP